MDTKNKQNLKLWTKLEDEFLIKHYTQGTMTSYEIAEVLGRPHLGVKSRATRLGIKWRGAISVPEGHAFCSACRGIYPIEQFNKAKSRPLGVSCYCKTCSAMVGKRNMNRWKEERSEIIEKECISCKQVKPVSEFWKSDWRRDGYFTTCRECSNAKRKLNRLKKNKEGDSLE